MHALAEQVFRYVVKEGGRLDPVAHFDLMAELDAAARATAAGHLPERLNLLDRPLVVPGAPPLLLYRPSYAGWAWINDCAGPWFGAVGVRYTLAVAYVMAQPRTKDALDGLHTAEAAWRAIDGWARGLNCALDGIRVCVEHVLGAARVGALEAAAAESGSKAGFESTLARLMRRCGGTLDYWLFEIADEQILALARGLSETDRHEAAAMGMDWKKGEEQARFAHWVKIKRAFLDRILGNRAQAPFLHDPAAVAPPDAGSPLAGDRATPHVGSPLAGDRATAPDVGSPLAGDCGGDRAGDGPAAAVSPAPERAAHQDAIARGRAAAGEVRPDEPGGVQGGQGVNAEAPAPAAAEPRGQGAQKEQQPKPRHEVHALGEAGKAEGSKPV